MADKTQQLRWHQESRTWSPEGNRLFGKVDSDEEHGIVVVVDGVRLTMKEFQRTLGVFEGWYFEIKVFDPADVEATPPKDRM